MKCNPEINILQDQNKHQHDQNETAQMQSYLEKNVLTILSLPPEGAIVLFNDWQHVDID